MITTMMKELENIKIIRELNYLRAEYDYKLNLIQSYNIDFYNWIEKILTLNTELREMYDSKKNVKLNKDTEATKNVEILEEEYSSTETDSKIKEFYRQIVKLTHPDKINSNTLNTLYNEANSAFKEGNKTDILLICDRLGLSYEISEEEREMLKNEIIDLRNKINYLESSYVYQWKLTDDENLKNKVALNYIKNLII
jgi:hypothetical protein